MHCCLPLFLKAIGVLSIGAWAPTAETPAGMIGAVAVSSGTNFSCALLSDGSVWCWGFDLSGVQGTGGPRRQYYAKAHPVLGLPGAAISVATGANHACALLTDGAVACWGADNCGQIGDGEPFAETDRPQLTRELAAKAKEIAAAGDHTCALLIDGRIQCWGSNHDGELGVPPVERQFPHDCAAAPSPPAVLPAPATFVATGKASTCALLADHTVHCFGLLGGGRNGVRQIVPRLGRGVRAIAVGDKEACAVNDKNSVTCWFREPGEHTTNGNGVPSPEPWLTVLPVENLGHTVSQLAAGGERTCIIGGEAKVSCWAAIDAESRDPTNLPSLFTRKKRIASVVEGLDAAVALAVGSHHACALDQRGLVQCWGNLSSGIAPRGELLVHPTEVVGIPAPGLCRGAGFDPAARCGGACPPCDDEKECASRLDCRSGVCADDRCQAPRCSDGVKNGAEPDVDCGAGCARPCASGMHCADERDCLSKRCDGGQCAAARCDDRVQNGDESDIDCGGTADACRRCTEHEHCTEHFDCASNVCQQGQCAPERCLIGDQYPVGFVSPRAIDADVPASPLPPLAAYGNDRKTRLAWIELVRDKVRYDDTVVRLHKVSGRPRGMFSRDVNLAWYAREGEWVRVLDCTVAGGFWVRTKDLPGIGTLITTMDSMINSCSTALGFVDDAIRTAPGGSTLVRNFNDGYHYFRKFTGRARGHWAEVVVYVLGEPQNPPEKDDYVRNPAQLDSAPHRTLTGWVELLDEKNKPRLSCPTDMC